ncbi:MAG: 4Fe-4S dicluster domain-containing protein [Actinomycetota bacterium]
MKLEDKLFCDRFIVDDCSHLIIKNPEDCKKCEQKQCTTVCPSRVYDWDGEKIHVSFEDCLECGTCRLVCQEFNNIDWNYPRGGFGVMFKFG